ncbi:MAG: hypothetical protein ACI9J2_002903 [Saprospiraceae bacterium]|jgi:hypothetical protein
MDNHYLIVIETIEGNLSQGMRQLNGVFTQKSNRRHRPKSHGSLLLGSSDPNDKPKIDLNYFSDGEGYDKRIF